MGNKPGKKTPMTPDAARRIQSHADRTKTNQGFKQRAQSTAAKNSGGKKGGGKKGG
ncbi:MAG: hypothetical protein H6739_34520 [Alphaproteobacteria bacterium]|nr:hypothetical protein [Alphaproteobacteria bacterium]